MTDRSDPALNAAARRLVEAEEATAAKAAAHDAARREQARVQSRIDAITTERDEIAARRARGDARGDDGARVALLALDGEALGALLERAKDAAEVARVGQEAAAREVAEARTALAQAEAAGKAAALSAHALVLGKLLSDTVGQHGAAAAAAGFTAVPAVRSGLVELAGQLDGVLVVVLHQLAAVQSGLPAWGPSGPLRDALRKVQAQLGTL